MRETVRELYEIGLDLLGEEELLLLLYEGAREDVEVYVSIFSKNLSRRPARPRSLSL
jgi:hypothetical protein